jgi:cytochrome c
LRFVFDADGNLYLATGDDPIPFQSDGYTPIDERPERNPAFHVQRSPGNTNDLRGKVLRITPLADGGYTVPDGNLFEAGSDGARPEIHVVGNDTPDVTPLQTAEVGYRYLRKVRF